MRFDKVPPHDLQAEASVLGGAMLEPKCLLELSEMPPHVFYRTGHQILWETMQGMFSRGEAIDVVTLVSALRRDDALDKVGGGSYVAELTGQVPTLGHVLHYAEIVKQHALRRQLLDATHRLETDLWDNEEVGESLAKFAQRSAVHGEVDGITTMKQALLVAVKDIEDAYQRKVIPGIELGWTDLDDIYRMQAGDLVVVAGRPGMGKTAFALEVARRASKSGHKVLFVSLEMTTRELVKRMLCQAGRVRSDALRTGNIREEDWGKISGAMAALSESNMDIWDRGGVSSAAIRALATKKAAKGGVDLIVVDYIQKVKEVGYGDKKHLEHGHTIQALKDLAKGLGCPVVALSQLNRDVDTRKGQEPSLSDLKGSGDIEQEADLAILLVRPEYYLKDKCPPEMQGIARVIIEKNRHGQTGEVRLRWEGQYFRFENLERRY